MDLTVLYEDKHLLVVNKPAGLLSVPGRGPDKADCFRSRSEKFFPGIREVHRLDQATSGLLVLAKTAEAHRRLSAAFSERKVRKAYRAVVAALPSDPGLPGLAFSSTDDGLGGEIRLFQHLDVENRPRQVVVSGPPGKEAGTHWRRLEDFSGNHLVELLPQTGRTHQLRLGMAACGAPILGDSLYAPEGIKKLTDRLMLQAVRLVFDHPIDHRTVDISAEADF